MRPSDTGRSTNCLINEVGIYIHHEGARLSQLRAPLQLGRPAWRTRRGDEALERASGPAGHASRPPDPDGDRLRRGSADGARGPREPCCRTTSSSQRRLSTSELRRHLAETLPSSLIPQYFTRLDALPLTPNGKIDVAALRAAAGDRCDAGRRPIPSPQTARPRSASRRSGRTCSALDRVGARTSFFELGGTSLGAMEVALRICREFEVDLPLQTVFTRPDHRAACHGRSKSSIMRGGRRSQRRRGRTAGRRSQTPGHELRQRAHRSRRPAISPTASAGSSSSGCGGNPRRHAPRPTASRAARQDRTAACVGRRAVDLPCPPGEPGFGELQHHQQLPRPRAPRPPAARTGGEPRRGAARDPAQHLPARISRPSR